MKNHILINNENGSAMLTAMMVLFIVTVMGVSAIETSTTEINIYRNERIYNTNFNQAEAAVFEAAARIEIQTDEDNLRPGVYTWMVADSVDLEDLTNQIGNYQSSLVDATYAQFASQARGIVSGGSLDMTEDSNVFGFVIYGLSQESRGEVLIETGYKKRI